MRRGLALAALLLVGCGGSHHRGGGNDGGTSAVLRTTVTANDSVGGLDAAGNPQIAYEAAGDGTIHVRTLAGDRSYGSGSLYPFARALTNDFVVGYATTDGSTVTDLRTGAMRTVAGVALVATDGDQAIWITTDGTRSLSIEDLSTAVRAPLPVTLGADDGIVDFRNGRLLLDRVTDVPVENGEALENHYQVVGLDGGLLATLRVPDGVVGARPVALNASGQAAGTATRPGAILAVDGAAYPVRWDATGEPAFLDTTTPAAVSGIADDGSVVVGPVEMNEGRLRLLRGGTPINLGISVPHPWSASVRGRYVFVQDARTYRISAYALP